MVGNKVTMIAAALLAVTPMTVAAADSDSSSGDNARPSFDKADANGDGKISIEEATDVGVPKAEAKREDIDNDGKLTKADWKFVDMNPDSKKGSDDDGS